MVHARMTIWKFKPGKRAEAVETVEGFMEEIRKTEGFRGMLTLQSMDDPNTATFIALWDSENTMNASQKGIYQKVSKKLQSIATEPPQLMNQEVHGPVMAVIFA